MVLPDPSNCTHAQAVSHDWRVNAAIGLQVITSAATFIPLAFITRHTALMRKLRVMTNKNLILIFCSGVFFVVVHALGICIFKGYSIVHTLTARSPCDFQWATPVCLSFKIPIYFCVFGFSTCHFVLFVERTLSTFAYKPYTACGRLPGFLLVMLAFSMSAVVVYFVYKNEDFSKVRSYCTSTSANTTAILGEFMFSMAVADLFITAGDCCIWLVNRAQLKRRFNKTISSYSLNHASRLRENHLSIRVVFPMALIHSAFFVTLFALLLWNRSHSFALEPAGHIFRLEINHWCICLYVLSSPCNLLFLLTRLEKEPEWLQQASVNPMDAHFRQLEALHVAPRGSILLRMQKLSTSMNLFSQQPS